MAVTSVVHFPNGTPRAPARVVPLLGTTIDQLAGLRDLIRQAQAAEREMTAEIIGVLEASGRDRAQGRQAEAHLEQRTTLRPDPELFLDAVGPAGYGALSVSVTAARKLLGADDLAAISEATTVPVLRLEPITSTPTAA